MKFVEPIRDIKKIAQIKTLLKSEENYRDLLFFELGINSALRITDLLGLKIGDIINKDGEVKEYFLVKEEKTGKSSKISITPKVRGTILGYKNKYPTIIEDYNNYLFFHKKRFPLGISGITRKQGWSMINKWCKGIGLSGSYGGHTLRKTWGYQARKKGVTFELIQHRLNHSSLAVTKRYLGITDDELVKVCNELDL